MCTVQYNVLSSTNNSMLQFFLVSNRITENVALHEALVAYIRIRNDGVQSQRVKTLFALHYTSHNQSQREPGGGFRDGTQTQIMYRHSVVSSTDMIEITFFWSHGWNRTSVSRGAWISSQFCPFTYE